MADRLLLPAPSWATAIDDGDVRSGITWRRVASIKPLAEAGPDQPREELELSVERYDLVDQTPEGFVLTKGQLLFFTDGDLFDLEQAGRLYAALGELLAAVAAEGGAR